MFALQSMIQSKDSHTSMIGLAVISLLLKNLPTFRSKINLNSNITTRKKSQERQEMKIKGTYELLDFQNRKVNDQSISPQQPKQNKGKEKHFIKEKLTGEEHLAFHIYDVIFFCSFTSSILKCMNQHQLRNEANNEAIKPTTLLILGMKVLFHIAELSATLLENERFVFKLHTLSKVKVLDHNKPNVSNDKTENILLMEM
eukprot:Pgem_evm1s2869